MTEQLIGQAANAASSGVQAVIGMGQMYYANKELKRLKKQGIPQYALTPQMQQAVAGAQEAAKRGYSPEQKGAAFGDANRMLNASYRRGMAAGGNTLAGAVSAGVNFNALKFLNDFYANDASLMASNIKYANLMSEKTQRIADMNTSNKVNLYNQEVAAAAELLNAGLYNITSGIQGHFGGGAKAASEGYTSGANFYDPNE